MGSWTDPCSSLSLLPFESDTLSHSDTSHRFSWGEVLGRSPATSSGWPFEEQLGSQSHFLCKPVLHERQSDVKTFSYHSAVIFLQWTLYIDRLYREGKSSPAQMASYRNEQCLWKRLFSPSQPCSPADSP